MAGKKFWDKNEKLKPAELEALQLKRLKWSVKHAFKNNPAYNKRLKKAKVEPSSIKKLADIEKIPFLTKDDLRTYYPFGLVSVPMEKVVELHASSGTTGKPVVGTYTVNDLDVWGEVMARNLYRIGIRKEDRMQNAYGYGLFTGAHGFERGAQKIGALVSPLSSGNTQRQAMLMKDFEATVLAATPSFCLYIAEVAQGMGMDPRKDFKLKYGVFGAESWSEEMRKKVEDVYDFKAQDHYGLTEIIGPGVSAECPERCGLHINADHFYTEIIDPQTGETLGPGEKGELVFTSLTKEAFPVLRFRTKDLSILHDEKCACGGTLPRHARLMGRSDDMMKVKGVIVFPKQIEEAIMNVKGCSENYVIIKSKKGAIINLAVQVEPDVGVRKTSFKKIEAAVAKEIMAILGLKVPVKVVARGTIPRSEGKAKRVIEK